jgi:hypothetical protein
MDVDVIEPERPNANVPLPKILKCPSLYCHVVRMARGGV